MKTYTITYSYEGLGECVIEAKNEAEAKELFLSGEFDVKKEIDSSAELIEIINS